MLSREETLMLLEEHGALQEGHFVLASGKHSKHYLQGARLTQHPFMLSQLIDDSVIELKEEYSIDTVLTAAIGGITVGQQVALLLGARSIFAERNDANELELKRGFDIHPGERILLAEDVVTTGGTLGELRDLVEEHDGELVGIFTLFNRSGKHTIWGSMKIHSALAIEFPLYAPEECPLCKNGVPAERPGTKEVEDAQLH